MFDMHSHVIYGVDDGAKSIEVSKNMCRLSAEQGVDVICATPHFIPEEHEFDVELVRNRLQEINDYCRENDINTEVVSGCECYVHPDIPKYIEEGKIPTINDGKYLLIEFPMQDMPHYINDVIYKTLLKGIIPIIAHPERYSYMRKNPKLLYELVEKGCLVQCNAGSFLGDFGDSVKRMAFSFLKHNLIHLIGSDAHTDSPTRRGPCMKEAIAAIDEFSEKHVDTDFFRDNGLRVVNNQDIKYIEPIEYDYHGSEHYEHGEHHKHKHHSSSYKNNKSIWVKISNMFAKL